MVKELKHCRSIEDLSCSDTVKHKARDYVRKYMAKQGPYYKADDNIDEETSVLNSRTQQSSQPPSSGHLAH